MDEIQKIYIAIFGRPADPLGLDFFTEATAGGKNLTAIGDLTSTTEYQARFEGDDNATVITEIYNSLFNRNPEAAGLAFFLAELASGRQTINSIAINIAQGAQGDDLATLNNKIEAANAFTTAVDQPDEIAGYRGDGAAEQGRQYLSGVTSDDATVPTAEQTDAAVAAAVNEGNSTGAVFTLTPGDDFADVSVAFRNGPVAPVESTFRFTSANETVTGSSATLAGGDVLVDSSNADQDRLNVSVAGATLNGISGATVTNIETLNIALNAANGTFDLTNYSGVETLVLTGTISQTEGVGDVASITGFADSGVTTIDASGVAAGNEAFFDGVATFDLNADQNITYIGGAGTDSLQFGDGDNTITLGGGINGAILGDGDNTVTAGTLGDLITVGDGDNTIDAGNGSNQVTAGDGDNSITTGSGTDFVQVGGGDNTIITGAGVDNIATGVGTGENTITAGAGADIITIGGTGGVTLLINSVTDTGATETTSDVVTGFVTGTDVIDFTDLVAATDAINYDEIAAGADFDTALTAANADFAASLNTFLYVFVTDGADGYVFVDSDHDGAADAAVQLTGLTTVADFSADDIV